MRCSRPLHILYCTERIVLLFHENGTNVDAATQCGVRFHQALHAVQGDRGNESAAENSNKAELDLRNIRIVILLSGLLV